MFMLVKCTSLGTINTQLRVKKNSLHKGNGPLFIFCGGKKTLPNFHCCNSEFFVLQKKDSIQIAKSMFYIIVMRIGGRGCLIMKI